MGREGILVLGAFAIGWAWLAFRSLFPDNALTLTAFVAIPQAALAVTLFVKCKCGDEKGHGPGQPNS